MRAGSVGEAAGLEASRALRRVLYRSAKRNARRRFHVLCCQVACSDILWRGWGEVGANRGAAGVDGLTVEAVEEFGVAAFLNEIAEALKEQSYRPALLGRV